MPNKVGEFLNPWGNLVQVSWPFVPVKGSSHWKANIGWLCGASRQQKNASFKSNTVKNVASGGIKLSRVYGFGTFGCKVSIAWFTSLKSCTGLYSSVPGFRTGKRGVFHSDWQGLSRPYFNRRSKCFWMPSAAHRGKGYCFTDTGVAIGFKVTTIGAIFLAIPGGLFSAHTPGGTCRVRRSLFNSVSNVGWTCKADIRRHDCSLGTERVIIPAAFDGSFISGP